MCVSAEWPRRLIARQFMLGLVQTANGIPLYREVFDGNTDEVTTLKPTIEKIIARVPIQRVIAVADRRLLSTDSLAELQAMRLPSGKPLEFILAVPGRRYSDFVSLLAPFGRAHCTHATQEVSGEVLWGGGARRIVAHNHTASEKSSAARCKGSNPPSSTRRRSKGLQRAPARLG